MKKDTKLACFALSSMVVDKELHHHHLFAKDSDAVASRPRSQYDIVADSDSTNNSAFKD